MANIGGNITGTVQTKTIAKDENGNILKNEIGEAIKKWEDAFSVSGWLGLQSGDSKYNNYSGIYALADQDTRMTIKGKMYDVLFIDNPDEMDEQLEIYLRKIGGQ